MPFTGPENVLRIIPAVPWKHIYNSQLERVLAEKRTLIKKVTILPIIGCILSVVNKVIINCTSLPRPADSNDIVIIKLKWKTAYLGHILFKPVLPSFVKDF